MAFLMVASAAEERTLPEPHRAALACGFLALAACAAVPPRPAPEQPEVEQASVPVAATPSPAEAEVRCGDPGGPVLRIAVTNRVVAFSKGQRVYELPLTTLEVWGQGTDEERRRVVADVPPIGDRYSLEGIERVLQSLAPLPLIGRRSAR